MNPIFILFLIGGIFRSPAVRKPFQRKPPVTDILNVYSQLPINETNNYVNVSFIYTFNMFISTIWFFIRILFVSTQWKKILVKNLR